MLIFFSQQPNVLRSKLEELQQFVFFWRFVKLKIAENINYNDNVLGCKSIWYYCFFYYSNVIPHGRYEEGRGVQLPRLVSKRSGPRFSLGFRFIDKKKYMYHKLKFLPHNCRGPYILGAKCTCNRLVGLVEANSSLPIHSIFFWFPITFSNIFSSLIIASSTGAFS